MLGITGPVSPSYRKSHEKDVQSVSDDLIAIGDAIDAIKTASSALIRFSNGASSEIEDVLLQADSTLDGIVEELNRAKNKLEGM